MTQRKEGGLRGGARPWNMGHKIRVSSVNEREATGSHKKNGKRDIERRDKKTQSIC